MAEERFKQVTMDGESFDTGKVFMDTPEGIAQTERYAAYLKLQSEAGDLSDEEYLAKLDGILKEGDGFGDSAASYSATGPGSEHGSSDAAREREIQANLEDDDEKKEAGTEPGRDGTRMISLTEEGADRTVNRIRDGIGRVLDTISDDEKQDLESESVDDPEDDEERGQPEGSEAEEAEEGYAGEGSSESYENGGVAGLAGGGAAGAVNGIAGAAAAVTEHVPEGQAEGSSDTMQFQSGADGQAGAENGAAGLAGGGAAGVADGIAGAAKSAMAQVPDGSQEGKEITDETMDAPQAKGTEPEVPQPGTGGTVLLEDEKAMGGTHQETRMVGGGVQVHEQAFQRTDFLDDLSAATGLYSCVQIAEYIPPREATVDVPDKPARTALAEKVIQKADEIQAGSGGRQLDGPNV